MLFLASISVADDEAVELQQVYITGGKDQIQTQPGSATLIDQTALEQFEYTDIHRVLNEVPGINIQEEDGYGLRPNIGMRGSSPERSKKIVIMEDGVLSGPAPYSAPAAYYFPNVSRMSAVEVFKGPSAIQYGPSTVAGALNLVSRAMPYAPQGEVDMQLGSFDYQRLNAYYGEQIGDFGYLIEALNVSTTGFKDLDNGEDTGFERNDFILKTSYDLNGKYRQRLALKLGYADEHSDETYVGLTKSDFNDDPNRRYAASSLDNMQWEHSQFQLTHVFEPTLTSQVTTDVYYNTFSRDWFKLNSFGDGSTVSVGDVLKDPTGNNLGYYEVLSGERNNVADFEQLKIGNNGRDYISQGIQTKYNTDLFALGYTHQLEVGVRIHSDQVKRHHSQQAYDMVSGQLQQAVGSSVVSTTENTGEVTALALYIKDDIEMGNTTLSLGLRSENIESKLTDHLLEAKANKTEEEKENVVKSSTQNVLLPGVGTFTQVNENFGILAGIHKGFVAVSPGQEGDVDAEESINYELGFRIHNGHQVEMVAYANDYSNLKESCSFSNGCDQEKLNSEFNGGEVLVYGLEANWKFQHEVTPALSLPVNVTYTFTQTEFQNTFTDDNGVFKEAGKDVEEGDELAYVPEHRLNIKAGIQAEKWSLMLGALYQGEMRDQAGQGSIPDADKIDSYVVLDLAANYQLKPELAVYGTVDNLMGEEYVVAAQPMGYRPGKPRAVQLGVKYSF